MAKGNLLFQQAPNLKPDHNLFDLSHSFKADMDMGFLYPVLCKQVVAGDVVRLGIDCAIRIEPMIVPISQKVEAKFYSFFVPYRILDKQGEQGRFESVISGGLTGEETRDFYRLKDITDNITYYGVKSTSSSSSSRTTSTLTEIIDFYAGVTSNLPCISSSVVCSSGVYNGVELGTSSNPEGYNSDSSYYPLDIVSECPSLASFGIYGLSDYLGIIPPNAFYGNSNNGLVDIGKSNTPYIAKNAPYFLNTVLAYPWLAYNRIYLDYFADEWLEHQKFEDSSGIFDNGNRWMFKNVCMQFANWEKDYFTSALPDQQKGTAPALGDIIEFSGTSSNSPLYTPYSSSQSASESSSKLYPSGFTLNLFTGEGTIGKSGSRVCSDDGTSVLQHGSDPSVVVDSSMTGVFETKDGNVYVGAIAPYYTSDLPSNQSTYVNPFASYLNNDVTWKDTGLFSSYMGLNHIPVRAYTGTIDFQTSASFDVADLRLAVQMQKFLERNARSGTRYTEFLRSHFNVAPKDARLDRPEYIGGTSGCITVSEVLQTSETTDNSPQGNYSGHGILAISDNKVVSNYHVKEFGLIMTILFLRPKSSYCQGVPREWTYGDRYEWYFPEFAHLSEQAIMNQELFADATVSSQSDLTDIFGYQGRYDELRTAQDRFAGNYRGNLDYWHLGRIFDSTPYLSYNFIKIIPTRDDLRRVFAYEGGDWLYFYSSNSDYKQFHPHFNVSIGFNLSLLRPMPFMPIPELLDHF